MEQPINHENLDEHSEEIQGFLALSRSANLYEGNFELFLQELLFTAVRENVKSRASFWRWDGTNQTFKGEILITEKQEVVRPKLVVLTIDAGEIFHRLLDTPIVVIPDAQTDFSLQSIAGSYLVEGKVQSILASGVVNNEGLVGLLMIERISKTLDWTSTEMLKVQMSSTLLAQADRNMQQKQTANNDHVEFQNYYNLFQDGPIPMWVYDPETMKFLDVNKESVRRYGFTRDEFLSMNILDIRPYEQRSKLFSYLKRKDRPMWMQTKWEHIYKDGTVIQVEIVSQWTMYNGKEARIVLAINKDQENELQRAKEAYYHKLNDYAFYASHNLRGPVANILGLVELLKMEDYSLDSLKEVINHMKLSANRLDNVISQLNAKVDLEDL